MRLRKMERYKKLEYVRMNAHAWQIPEKCVLLGTAYKPSSVS